MNKRWWYGIGLGVSLFLVFNGCYIQLKALVAQWLLEDAWETSIVEQANILPWPWADIWPVAKMMYAPAGANPVNPFEEDTPIENWVVIHEASGQGLAFGPSLVTGSVDPGEAGWLIISAHRDTQFGFLKDAQAGDVVEVQNRRGRWHRYILDTFHVVDSRQAYLPGGNEVGVPGLLLVTCYPFDPISFGGPDRLVAVGRYLGERS